jgi:hypothetical protein
MPGKAGKSSPYFAENCVDLAASGFRQVQSAGHG